MAANVHLSVSHMAVVLYTITNILFITFNSFIRMNFDQFALELVVITVMLLLDEMSAFVDNLQQLIVSTYEENGHQPVILLAHSMGNLYLHYLLTHQSQKWKDKYIRSFISLAGPWGGAVKSVRLEISGWLVVVLHFFCRVVFKLVYFFHLPVLIAVCIDAADMLVEIPGVVWEVIL